MFCQDLKYLWFQMSSSSPLNLLRFLILNVVMLGKSPVTQAKAPYAIQSLPVSFHNPLSDFCKASLSAFVFFDVVRFVQSIIDCVLIDVVLNQTFIFSCGNYYCLPLGPSVFIICFNTTIYLNILHKSCDAAACFAHLQSQLMINRIS